MTDAEQVNGESAEAKPASGAGSDAGSSEQDLAEQVSVDLDELGEAKRERDEYLEVAQRTRADFDNYRKRVAKEAADAQARGKVELVRALVPVLDNLERAIDAAATESGSVGLRKGVTLVRDELRAILDRAGVEAYDPAGEPFDPAWHEAVTTEAAEGRPPGTVLETIDRGYRLDGQVLRPARVVVSE